MNKLKLNNKNRAWGLTAFLVIICCIIFYSVIQYWPGIVDGVRSGIRIISPFIWGAILAYLLSPFVRVLQNKLFEPLGERIYKGKKGAGVKKSSRGMAVAFAIIFLLVLISALFYLIIPQLYESIESLIKTISLSITRLQDWADRSLEAYPILEENFSGVLNDLSGSFTKWLKESLMPQMNNIISSVSTGVFNVVKGIARALLALVASIYIMFNREQFSAQLKKLLYSVFSTKNSTKILAVARYTDGVFRGFFVGQILDSIIVGIITYFGCLIIGIKDPILIAVIIGITNIFPVIGPYIGTIPSALIILMYSPIKSLIFVVFIIVLQQFDSNVLNPKIVGNRTGLSGFWVIFAIIVGGSVAGPFGTIVGVPLFAVLSAGVKALIYAKLKKRGLPVETKDYYELDYIDPDTDESVKFGKEDEEAEADQK